MTFFQYQINGANVFYSLRVIIIIKNGEESNTFIIFNIFNLNYFFINKNIYKN